MMNPIATKSLDRSHLCGLAVHFRPLVAFFAIRGVEIWMLSGKLCPPCSPPGVPEWEGRQMGPRIHGVVLAGGSPCCGSRCASCPSDAG